MRARNFQLFINTKTSDGNLDTYSVTTVTDNAVHETDTVTALATHGNTNIANVAISVNDISVSNGEVDVTFGKSSSPGTATKSYNLVIAVRG